MKKCSFNLEWQKCNNAMQHAKIYVEKCYTCDYTEIFLNLKTKMINLSNNEQIINCQLGLVVKIKYQKWLYLINFKYNIFIQTSVSFFINNREIMG